MENPGPDQGFFQFFDLGAAFAYAQLLFTLLHQGMGQKFFGILLLGQDDIRFALHFEALARSGPKPLNEDTQKDYHTGDGQPEQYGIKNHGNSLDPDIHDLTDGKDAQHLKTQGGHGHHPAGFVVDQQ
jgi:hypothetical protein